MAVRAYWKGSLKLSLVSCPVLLYPATTTVDKTCFHMINKETGNRLKQQMVDAETGDVVEGDQKGRGYELKKGEYVEVDKDELEAVQIESNHTIDIDSFVPLRYPYELRDEEDYFDDIKSPKISKDMVELASHILDTKAAHFDPSKFKDEYENALKTLVKRKAAGKPVKSAEREERPDNVISLMDALRQSLRARHRQSGRRTPRRVGRRTASQKKAHRSAARARKAS
jgi:non-homologous end joining protein Ku